MQAMCLRIFKSGEILAPYIKFYWTLNLNQLPSSDNSIRIIPNGLIGLTIHYGDHLINTKQNNQFEKQSSSLISGQTTEFFDITQTGKTGMVTVLFKPHGARLFLNMPLTEITDRNIELDSVFGNEANELTERVALAKNDEKRIEIIEFFLSQKIREKNFHKFRRIDQSIKLIDHSGGNIKVDELAKSACLSNKQYERTFNEFIGLSPKQFSRIVRFQNALSNKQTNKDQSFTELAHTCGYYDQAHFNNEIKLFTGYTPKTFFSLCEPFSDYYF